MSTISSLWSRLEDQLLPVFADYRSRLADLPIEVKGDRTLLTQADIAVQELVVAAIRDFDGPGAVVIAEEDEQVGARADVAGCDGRVWIVDPIDGTAEFVRNESVEFCSVVCLLEDWQPRAAFVLAPELGSGRVPVSVSADARTSQLLLDGRKVSPTSESKAGMRMSATRSRGEERPAFDAAAHRAGYELKTRTTSQTLDMLRTAVDLSDRTTPSLASFDLFWRRKQKLWDGAAGLCMAMAAGLRSCDESGEPLRLTRDFLSGATPTFPADVTGRPEAVAWFLEAGQV
ncbi:inositol monophosphatase family protein [Streptomyces sp. SID9124]|uniref:inositol monophosphatase family protein n=1 Tax=Streptomyces sp. SID9124 TaxID=2706108 RepID=UPI0013E05079|nr:inositol monophosphatase family protein [Streptomyces sp. SID9124]NED12581.1 inositol monophosphatase family protein [Streptomyces sp. SID9124]